MFPAPFWQRYAAVSVTSSKCRGIAARILHRFPQVRRYRREETMKLETLRDLYVEQLQDLYSAETQLVEALPKMAKAASHQQLQNAFTEHLAQTKGHVQRLE